MKKLSVLFAAFVVLALIMTFIISCAEPEPAPAPSPAPAPAPAPAPEKKVTLRFSSPYPMGDANEYVPQEMSDRFNQRAGGKYIIEFHPAGTLVSIAEGLDAVRTKTVEMAVFPTGPCAAVDPRFSATEIPFIYNNIEANAEAMMNSLPLFNDILQGNFNQKSMAITAGGAMELISKKQIKTLEDFQGVLTQSLSPPLGDFIKLLGGSPISVPGPESYTALQKGVIDAALTPPDAMRAFGMWEVAKYVTYGYFAPTADVYTVNLEVYNAMPKDIQDIFVEEMEKMGKDIQDIRIKQWAENPDLFISKGMEIYTLPDEERNKWKAISDPVFPKMLDEMGDFGKQFRDIADKANAKFPY